jgi:nucleotide-binding universal stress UspA family protein
LIITKVRKLIYKNILLPIDGSENSKRASEHAVSIADLNNGNITVLFVIEPNYPRLPILPISTLPSPDENYFEELRDEGKGIIKEFEKQLEQNGNKNVQINTSIKEGKAYIEILDSINRGNFDLVIIGASGRHSALERFTIGSVTERVIREAQVPVMVIP